MIKKASIDDFLKQKKLAIVGVSQTGKKFSNRVYRELKSKGYIVYPVNPKVQEIEGVQCFENIASIPEKVDGAVVLVPPAQAEQVVRDADAADVKHIWLQQGAASQEAIDFCEGNGINVIHRQCILMFAEPTSFPHGFHRRVWEILGQAPK